MISNGSQTETGTIFLFVTSLARELLLAVSSAYAICEAVQCSACIAAVVCGICFATFMDKSEQKNPGQFVVYRDFWSVIDVLLNSMLYVLLGLTFISEFRIVLDNISVLLIAILVNIAARYLGALAGTALSSCKPSGHNTLSLSALLTWTGLKGALCLALAMSASTLLDSYTFHILLSATFGIVMFTTIGQVLTIGRFYKHQANRLDLKSNQ